VYTGWAASQVSTGAHCRQPVGVQERSGTVTLLGWRRCATGTVVVRTVAATWTVAVAVEADGRTTSDQTTVAAIAPPSTTSGQRGVDGAAWRPRERAITC